MRRLQERYAIGAATLPEVRQRLMAWIGHARHANSYRLRARLFRKLNFQRAVTV